MGVLDSLFKKRDSSANAAKTRLLKVLVDDRYKLTPEMMSQLKLDLAEVFARYIPSVDPNSIEVTLLRGESNDHLKADIPLRRPHNT
jgi:cell division topological specificity factor